MKVITFLKNPNKNYLTYLKSNAIATPQIGLFFSIKEFIFSRIDFEKITINLQKLLSLKVGFTLGWLGYNKKIESDELSNFSKTIYLSLKAHNINS